MNNLFISLFCLIFIFFKCNASPVSRALNFFDVLYTDDIDAENSIEGSDTIDLSSLGPEAYGFPNNESGYAVASWSESSQVNPEEVGEYAQGDILMPPQQGRNGVREESLRWPKGHIPYVIEGDFTQQQRETIMLAIADYHRLTCLRFVPYNGQADYITIQSKNTGCWSSVGKIGGRQEVNLQSPGCVTKKGTVIHELLHAVGFMHEQSRPERDDFVYVRYNNIRPGAENNFRKADRKHTNDFQVPYDYNSVMHYSEYAFSKNQQKTIEPKVGGVKLGQREGLSRGDVKKVNNMYGCKKDGTSTAGYRPPRRFPTNAGFQRPAFNRPDFNRPAFNGPNFNRPAFSRPEYNRPAFNRPNYNGPVFNRPDYNRPVFNRPEFNRPTFNRFPRPLPVRRSPSWGGYSCCGFRCVAEPFSANSCREPQSGWFGNVFQNWFGHKSN